jgi:phosphate transport system protein
MSEHTVAAFDEELGELAVRVAQMGGLVEKALTEAVLALDRADEDLARRVIEADGRVDELERDIEERAVRMIARRQPMAGDLREIMTAIKIASDLERIGDLAKNIAKRSLAVHGQAGVHQAVRGIDRMSRMALEQLRGVLDAYAQRDVETALEVWRQDADLDAMYTSIFRELLTYMMEDPRAISFATHLLFAAKNVERIGDHTTNIAEMIYLSRQGRTAARGTSEEGRLHLRSGIRRHEVLRRSGCVAEGDVDLHRR